MTADIYYFLYIIFSDIIKVVGKHQYFVIEMYLKLIQICFFFESVLEAECNYFNTKDYQIYSAEEHKELVNDDTYEASVFLPIPQIDRNEIVVKYLAHKNNQSLMRKQNHKDFYHLFHRYTEDNQLVDNWNSFEKSELMKFASEWCKQNQVKFTLKQQCDLGHCR